MRSKAVRSTALQGARRLVSFLFILSACAVKAGPFAPAPGASDAPAVFFGDTRISAWATGVASLVRGPVDIALPNGAVATYGEAEDALGPATDDPYDVVSLGDGGRITLTFDAPIRDHPGSDFAVFENGFADNAGAAGFLELAFVEVSSDGVQFFRFPSESLTPVAMQIGPFGWLDPTNIRNLAGKYGAGYGVPFDLAEWAGTPGLDLAAVTQVRLVDVIGTIGAAASRDSVGRIINDPYPTNFDSGGFDLSGVAVLAPELEDNSDWIAAHFNAENRAFAGAELDPDHDGWTNLQERAFGGDPHQPEGRSPLSSRRTGGVFEVRFLRVPWQGDLIYAVEFSEDLQSWTEGARGSGGQAIASTRAGITVADGIEVVVSTSDPAWQYGRVRILLNP